MCTDYPYALVFIIHVQHFPVCCVHSASSLWVFPAGVQYVFDTTLAAGFSILESQKEFIQRYRRRHHDSHALPMFTSSCPGKPSSLLCLPHTPPTLYCCFFFSSFFQTPTPLYWFGSVIIICAGVCLSFKISLFCKSPGSFLSEFLCVCWTWGFRGADSRELLGKDRELFLHHSLYQR